jgi:hypothetical protein
LNRLEVHLRVFEQQLFIENEEMKMAKQTQTNQENYLPSLVQGNRVLSRHASSLAVESATSRDGEHMLREASKHQLAMKIHVVKTATAMRQAGELQVHASQVFSQTCTGIDAVSRAAEGSESKPYIDQLSHHLKDQCASHLAEMYDECVEQLRTEASRTVSMTAPEEKQGFFQSLFGG